MAINFNRHLTAGEVIPWFRSEIFRGHEDAQFAVGMLAEGGRTKYDEAMRAYYKLRANVYVHQTQMLDFDHVDINGGERDEDDGRSIHMGIIENMGDEQRMVGSMRLIVKGDQPLPIELYFPEVFDGNPAPSSSCEVSRFIARHEDHGTQDSFRAPLFMQALAEIICHNMGPTYGIIEPYLRRLLKAKRVKFQDLGEPVFLPAYNEINQPVVIDTEDLARQMEQRHPGVIRTMIATSGEFMYFGNRTES